MTAKHSNEKLVEYLKRAVQMEISATHQYQLHAHTLEDWGLARLAKKMRGEIAEEMGHSDLFIERLLYLKETPELGFDTTPQKAKDLKNMFQLDLKDEEEAISYYTQAALHAQEVGDIGTRVVFEKALLEEEGHRAWLELQLDMIERIGEANYSAKFMSTDESGDEEEAST